MPPDSLSPACCRRNVLPSPPCSFEELRETSAMQVIIAATPEIRRASSKELLLLFTTRGIEAPYCTDYRTREEEQSISGAVSPCPLAWRSIFQPTVPRSLTVRCAYRIRECPRRGHNRWDSDGNHQLYKTSTVVKHILKTLDSSLSQTPTQTVEAHIPSYID